VLPCASGVLEGRPALRRLVLENDEKGIDDETSVLIRRICTHPLFSCNSFSKIFFLPQEQFDSARRPRSAFRAVARRAEAPFSRCSAAVASARQKIAIIVPSARRAEGGDVPPRTIFCDHDAT
jgi:hypothetical protein